MNGISHKQAIQLLNRRMDGILNESERLSLEEHLRSCDTCRDYATTMDGFSAHLQNEFHRRWDTDPGPSQNVFERVITKASNIPTAKRISSGAKLFAGALALIVLGIAVNFVISRLQSTSPATNATETASTLPQSRLLAFASDQSGNLDIYTMRADGSGLTNLTNHPANDSNPIWSPDGKHIAFESDRDGFRQIYLINADGSNLARLTNEEADHGLPLNRDGKYNPWSPDGSKLVFVQEDPGGETAAIYSVDVNGQNKVKLFDGKNLFGFISWSPDGNHIAFILNDSPTPRENYVPDIYIVDSDGNQLRELQSFLPEGETLAFTPYYWSSNGQSIVFTSYTVTNGPLSQTLYEFDVITNTFSNRTETRPDVMEWRDGIALRIEVNQDAMPYVWERPDGTTQTFEESKAWGQTCSLDSTRSFEGNYAFGVYCPHDKFNLYWTNADGSTIKKILTLPVDLSMGGVGDIAWSPDEQYIAFNLTTDEKTEMYLLKVEDALANPSIEPLRFPVSTETRYRIPSWQPVVNENLAKQDPTPQPKSTPTGLLAFASDQNGNFDIYTMHADGSGLTNLTNSPAADVDPFWSPDGQQIAFASDRDGSMQIYLMDADGSNVVQLTNNEASHGLVNYLNDFSLWSPDGSKLIFSETLPGETDWKLFAIDTNGTNKTPLVEKANIYSAISWSPDGGRIALQADDRQNLGGIRLYVVNADGSDLREVTASLQQNEQLSVSEYYWSQDGQSIFFVAFFQKTDPYWTAYEARLDDNTLVEHARTTSPMGWWNGITLLSDVSDSSRLKWERPDGTSTALDIHGKCQEFDASESGSYIQRSSNGNWAISAYCPNGDTWFYWANSDGTVIKPLLNTPISNPSKWQSPISWSQDDKFIAFAVESTTTTDLYILNVSETRNDHFVPPVKMPKSFDPSWQPVANETIAKDVPTPQPKSTANGLLAFTSEQNGNSDIYTMHADGSGLKNITNHPANDFYPFWSPDGQRIAFTSDRDGSSHIYLMDADGSNVLQLTNGEGRYALDVNGYSPWSPDGKKLVFFQKLPGEAGTTLHIMDVADGTITTLTKEPGAYFRTSWSPDGEFIAFIAADSAGTPRDLFIAHSDGDQLVKLTENRQPGEFFLFEYAWSQDGKTLNFFTRDNAGGNYTSTVYADGSLTVLHRAEKGIIDWWEGTVLLNDPEATLTWRRTDGSQSTLDLCPNSELFGTANNRSERGNLALAVNCSEGGWMFYRADPHGTKIDQLLDSPIPLGKDSFFNLAWSPDERYLTFVNLGTASPDITKTLYILDVLKAREDPSLQPLKMANSFGPSWQPVAVQEIVEDQPTPEPTQAPPSKSLPPIGTGKGNGEWIAFRAGNIVPNSVEPTAATMNLNVYKVHPDGSELTNLTGFPAHYYGLQWSPDGQHLLFMRENPILNKIEIFRHYAGVGASFGEVTRPISDPDHYGYSWSPNSDKIVFADSSSGNYDIYTVYADGRNDPKLTQLTDDPAQDVGFAWSPDGSQIAFQRLDGDKLSIYVMNADGSDQREVAKGTGKVTLHWSQDGTAIYASSTETHWLECEGCVAKPGIYRIDLYGPSVHQIYYEEDANQIAAWYLYNTPQDLLYFMRINHPNFVEFWGTWFHADGHSATEIGELDPQQTCKTTTGNILNESISPNPRFSVISNFCAGGFDLYLADREAAPEKRFTHLLQLPLDTEGQGGDFATLPMGWSPDGRWLIYDDGHGTMMLVDIERAIQDPEAALAPLVELNSLTGPDGQLYQSPETLSFFGLVWQPGP